MKVKKRDGSIEEFSINKIISAVEKAFKSCDNMMDVSFEKKLYNWFIIRNVTLPIERIQKDVENLLMAEGYYDEARSYITYRNTHDRARFIRERIDYMNEYSQSNSNAASASETDANSNVSVKNVANLEGEVYKTTNRIIQRQRMKDKLNELFPEVAKEYEEDLNNSIIYVHDEASSPVLKYYCCAVTLYPLILEGSGNMDNITPSAPNDIQSFSGQITNLAFLLSSQCKGAVAFGDYFIMLNYYVIKEFGKDWYNKLNEEVTTNISSSKRTVLDCIKKGMKQFIYGVNQPAGNRSYNSPFTNVSYYDSIYFKALFEDFIYPDGTKPEWKAIDILQRIFMKLHRDLRLIKPLTFPVSTIAMVYDGKDFLDKEYKELCAEEWAKGGSFFCYNSNNPTSLSSCCFHKDTKILWKSSTEGVKLTTLEELHNTRWEPDKKNLRIFHNGSWIKGKSIKLPNREMFKVITYNNKEFIMSDNHINVTYDGEKSTRDLTTDDYLMFNTSVLSSIPENNEHLTYEQGLLVGLFIGDGTFGNYVCQDGSVHSFQLSLNKDKWDKVKDVLNTLGEFRLGTIYNNVYPIYCNSKELTTFISKWTTNEPNKTTALNKSLNLNCLTQSIEFRKGILDGWYITDGGNSNRCYTVSKELVENMEILCTSLGLQTIIDISDRTDEAVIIRGQEFNRNYPLYCLRWYTEANHRTNKTPAKTWKKKNNSIYWKIKSIEPVDYKEDIYCIQCNNSDEPYFTLPCGLITHNCRVLNEITDNTFSSTTGNIGIMTGSCNVITLNINRIVQDCVRLNCSDPGDIREIYPEYKMEILAGIKRYLISILERVYKYHITYKTMLYDVEDKGMFTASNAGYIKMSKLYSTIGVIGYTEAAKYMSLSISNNREYKEFLKLIFGTISTFVSEKNKIDRETGNKDRPFQFNIEAVPGEGLGVKLYEADKKDGYFVPEDQNLYNCYFYNPWDDTSVLDKLKLHGKEVSKYLSGGQACHINLDTHLSKEQYLKLLDVAREEGCNYFTFNIPMSECKDCGHTVNAPIEECPKCKSTNIKYWTRIIGYLTAVDNWSKARQIEQKNRVYSKLDKLNKYL